MEDTSRGTRSTSPRFCERARERAARAARALSHPVEPRELASQSFPLLLPLVLAPWLYVAIPHYAGAALWNDVTAMSYCGWCIGHGVRMYDGVALPDGPFAFALHSAFTLLAGTADQALRHLDLALQALTGLTLGWLLVPRTARPLWPRRMSWALVGGGLWMSQLIQTDYGSSCQREGYWVALGTLGITLVYASWEYSRPVARAMLFTGSLLTGWLMFGKQTGVLYVGLAVLAAMLLPRDPAQTRAWRLRWIGAGVAIAVASMLVFVVAAGSLRGFTRWYFQYVFDVYRYFEPTPWTVIVAHGDRHGYFLAAALVLFGGGAAVALGALPARALVFAIAPAVHTVAVLAQRKGYLHQYVPIRTSVYFFYLVALVSAWVDPSPSTLAPRGAGWAAPRAIVALTVLLFVGWRCMQDVQHAPWLLAREMHTGDAEVMAGRQAGRYIREHTAPSDRVFYLGNDSRVELAAERPPALAEQMVLMLEPSIVLGTTGDFAPSPAARTRIEDLQRDWQARACSRVLKEHPAAVVLATHGAGTPGEVYGFCPALRERVEHDYRQTAHFGRFDVYLANDHS